jgi:hypothetical protein
MLLLMLCLVACGHSPSSSATSAGTVVTPSVAQPAASAKIAASLRHVVQRLRTDGITAANAAARHAASYSTPWVRVDASGRIQAVIRVTQMGEDVQAQLKQHQVQLEHLDSERQLIQAWVPFGQLESIAMLSFVRYIQPPSYAVRRSSLVMVFPFYEASHVTRGYAAARHALAS